MSCSKSMWFKKLGLGVLFLKLCLVTLPLKEMDAWLSKLFLSTLFTQPLPEPRGSITSLDTSWRLPPLPTARVRQSPETAQVGPSHPPLIPPTGSRRCALPPYRTCWKRTPYQSSRKPRKPFQEQRLNPVLTATLQMQSPVCDLRCHQSFLFYQVYELLTSSSVL